MNIGLASLSYFGTSFFRVINRIDNYWFIILIISFVLTSVVNFIVKYTFSSYSRKFSKKVISGSEAAKAVLLQSTVYGVNVVKISGNLTDHYDSRSMEIRLSEGVYENTSIAAVSVACHEAAHAIQHAYGSSLFKARFVAAEVCDVVTRVSGPLLLIGFLFGVFQLVYVGIIMYSASVVFNLLTLPLEISASKKAIEKIETCNILDIIEIKGARKVLAACAMTYVASLTTSLLYLFRFIVVTRKKD